MMIKLYKTPMVGRKLVNLSIVSIVSLTVLTGCGEDDFSDLNQYIAEVKLRPKGTIDPLPANEPVAPFIFKPEDLRDPFKPIKPVDEPTEGVSNAKTSGIKPPIHRKEELEAFPIETLKMIGTVNMKSSLWALVKSTDKTVYRVRVGNYMGQNYGKIIRITPDKIELMETVPDQQKGMWKEQQMSIMLTDETGG
jgi:type IV pilus assembly protein PilP